MFTRKLKQLARPKSELEQQLAEALSKESWGAPNSLLQQIAIATEEDDARMLVLQHVFKVLEEKDKQWRRVFKGMVLVETILKRGSVRIIEDIKHDKFRIQTWKERRVMEGGKDVAGGIREKASYILHMLDNPAELNQERHKNYEMYSKFQGVGTEAPTKKGFRHSVNKAMDKAMPNHDDMVANEAEKRQKEFDTYMQVQEFTSRTGATQSAANYHLRRNHGNVNKAIEEYKQSQGSGFGDSRRGSGDARKPSFTEQRTKCEQVRSIAEVSESRAMEILERCGWDVERAIEMAASGGNGGNPQEDSASETESESSAGSYDNRRRGGGRSPNKGSRGASQGWGSPSSNRNAGSGWPSQPSSYGGTSGFDNSPWPSSSNTGGGFGTGFDAPGGNSGFGGKGGFGGQQGGSNQFGGNGGFGGKGGQQSQDAGGAFGGGANAPGGFGGTGFGQQETYAERVAKRKEENGALKEAMSILEKWKN